MYIYIYTDVHDAKVDILKSQLATQLSVFNN